MDLRNHFLTITLACLLAACGDVGDGARPAVTATLDRDAAAVPSAPPAPQPEATGQPAQPAVPARDTLTDPAISARIESAMKADPAMSGADVSINTDNGVVVLSGTVKSHEQTGIASAHAQRQDGVMRVDNQLKAQLS